MSEKEPKGQKLPCPSCGQAKAMIYMDIDIIGGFTCRECDAEFTREDIELLIAAWTPILAWIDQFPEGPKES